MTLCKSPPVSNKKVTKSLAKTLDAQEREWMEKQKLISEEKLTRDCKDALKATEYVHAHDDKKKLKMMPHLSQSYTVKSPTESGLQMVLSLGCTCTN